MAFWNKTKEESDVTSTPVAPVTEPETKKNKRRGKPQDRTKLTRNKVVQIRLTEDEVAKLKAAAATANMTLADFVMAAAEGSPVIVINEVPKLIAELRRQGVNLNQAIRIAYQTGSADLDEIKGAVKLCVQAQTEVLQLCERWNMRLRNGE